MMTLPLVSAGDPVGARGLLAAINNGFADFLTGGDVSRVSSDPFADAADL